MTNLVKQKGDEISFFLNRNSFHENVSQDCIKSVFQDWKVVLK